MHRRLRCLWLTIHRWLGLTAGLLFVLLGLSGSVLVFHRTIDEWLNPHLLQATSAGPHRRLAEITASARAACPDLPPPAYLSPPRAPGGVYLVYFLDRSKSAGPRWVEAAIDPATAAFLGRRVRGEYLTSWVYDLHDTLLLKQTGHTIVGVTGLLLLLSTVSGLYLWWPILRSGGARRAFAIKWSKLNFDLHKSLGAASSALLIVIAFTGTYLVFPGWFKPWVTAVSPESVPNPKELRSKPASGRDPIDADQAAFIARQHFPAGELMRLQFPPRPDGVYIARVRQPGEVRRSSAASRIWIDQYSGEVLALFDWHQRTPADTFFGWQFPLHNGEAFGLFGRWIVFVTGLIPALLYVTGCLLWWRKRKSRQKQFQRQSLRASSPC